MFLKWRNVFLVVIPSVQVLCEQVVLQPAPDETQFAPFTRVVGTLICAARDNSGFVQNRLRMLPITINGIKVTTDRNTGFFNVSGSFPRPSVHLELSYDGPISTSVNGSTVSTRLQVMDDVHETRSEGVNARGIPHDTILDLGRVTLTSV